ncbi:MAG: hypothetical protein PVI57_13850 [Gemmatimonadota bacterium]|jgi:hypothetical protein
MAICDFGEGGVLVDCTYSFLDFEADPPVIERTSSAELISESGVLGLFVDPLILQVPAGASNFTGTFDDGTGPRGIVATETASFDAQPGATVNAEAGQKFVILEFPPDVVSALESAGSLDGPFDFSFEFELPALAPVDIKAMYTGKIEDGGQTFYAPMFPCVTDFADVPALTLPASQAPVDLMAQVVGGLLLTPDLGCDGVVYDYTDGGPPPGLGVTIDIKPGSDPNSINCGSPDEVVPVAILSSDAFDATTVDHATVEFEGATEAHVDRSSGEPRRHEEDVDGDGDVDLVFHFRVGDTGLGCASTGGTLTGRTIDGRAIEGSDAVRMVGA